MFHGRTAADRQPVRGEHPPPPFPGLAQSGSASALGAEGRWFKSSNPDHIASWRPCCDVCCWLGVMEEGGDCHPPPLFLVQKVLH